MTKTSKPPPSSFIPYSDGDLDPPAIHEVYENSFQTYGTALFEQPIIDHLIHAELNLPKGEEMKKLKVVGRSKGNDGNIIGKYDSNPMINTMVYDAEFPDASIHKYGENLIAENMYSQVYSEGFSCSILYRILDFTKDRTAVQKGDKYIITKSGQRHMIKSTVGWNLLIAWEYGSKQWIPLSFMKESYPIEVAEFATTHGISDEPAFAWWVLYTLRKRDKIISAVNAWVKRTTHKYGVAAPFSVEEAYALDTKNGKTLCRDALSK